MPWASMTGVETADQILYEQLTHRVGHSGSKIAELIRQARTACERPRPPGGVRAASRAYVREDESDRNADQHHSEQAAIASCQSVMVVGSAYEHERDREAEAEDDATGIDE